ncbi:hypothetical protein KG892_00950 [Vermiphilus pyriformis]|nr:MAG: hypothetical protein KG892_00950 [Vermiphilus pyriformis]
MYKKITLVLYSLLVANTFLHAKQIHSQTPAIFIQQDPVQYTRPFNRSIAFPEKIVRTAAGTTCIILGTGALAFGGFCFFEAYQINNGTVRNPHDSWEASSLIGFFATTSGISMFSTGVNLLQW